MTHRVRNFGAGPGALPLAALEEAQAEFCDFQGTGMSILEHSHRGKAYDAVHEEAKSLLGELLRIPDTHDVLLLQGGASMQFAMIPMAFATAGSKTEYVVCGTWGEKAFTEGETVARMMGGEARVVGRPQEVEGRTALPSVIEASKDAAYLHITTNETIHGIQYGLDVPVPRSNGAPLVCDMSSDFLWKETDIRPYSLVYAGAQKNAGPSGLCVVIVEKAFAEKNRKDIPKMLRYDVAAKNDSRYNTPPTFSIYLMRNVLRWVKREGGLAEMERRNRTKATTLYETVDRFPTVFRCPVHASCRSVMNAVFTLVRPELEQPFFARAEAESMMGIKGHRSVGGARVSMYNAVSVDDVKALTSMMTDFARSHA